MAKKLLIGSNEVIVPEKTDIANQISTAISGKLDKVTSTTTYVQLYAKTIDGNQAMVNFGTGAIDNGAVQRKSNGLFRLKDGNTASRPTTNLNAGDLYFNTELGKLEVYNGTEWLESGSGGIPEAPDIGGSDGIFYFRDGFSETWVPAVDLYTKADFGDVEIDPYDKTSLLQLLTVLPSLSTQTIYNGSGEFSIYMDAKFNVTLVDGLNQKQEILTNAFGMLVNGEDPKWVGYKDLGSIKNLGTFANSNGVIEHLLVNNLPTGLYRANVEEHGGFEVIINYQRTLTAAKGTVQSFDSLTVVDIDLSGVEPVFVRNDQFHINAETLPYDNSGSGLLATNVGQAIDELSSGLGDIEDALDAILGV